MFFVVRGSVCVLVPNPHNNSCKSLSDAVSVQEITAEEGGYFGEVALVQDSVRTAWVRAQGYVLVALLQRRTIHDIWRFWPKEREALIKKAGETARRDLERVRVGQECRRSPSSAGNSSDGHLSPQRSVVSGDTDTKGVNLRSALARARSVTFQEGGHDVQEIVMEGQGNFSRTSSLAARSPASHAILAAAKLLDDIEVPDSSNRFGEPVSRCVSEDFFDQDSSNAFGCLEQPLPPQLPTQAMAQNGLRHAATRDNPYGGANPPADLPPCLPEAAPVGIMLPDCLEPRAAGSASAEERQEEAMPFLIKNLAELVQGQSGLQAQVADLVKRIAAFEGATLVLSQDSPVHVTRTLSGDSDPTEPEWA